MKPIPILRGFVWVLAFAMAAWGLRPGQTQSATAPTQATVAGSPASRATRPANAKPVPAAKKPAVNPDPPAGPAAEYVLGPGDVVAIDVYGNTEISRTLPITPDGRLTLPLAGDIQAQGLTTDQLQAVITEKLKQYIAAPNVAVMLQSAESHYYNVLGMAIKPGTYPLSHPITLLDAIAAAGGLAPFAKGNKIYVLRKRAGNGAEMRIYFNYVAVSQGKHVEQNIAVQAFDTIVIP